MKYIKLTNGGNTPVFLCDKTWDKEANSLVDVTTEDAAALGFKPLIENAPNVGENQIARITGYHEDGENIVADYTVVEIENATAAELKELLSKFDTSKMNDFEKTELLKLLAKLGRN